MKNLGTGIVAFITPRLNYNLPEGVSIPTLPTDILCGILIVAGIAKSIFDERNG